MAAIGVPALPRSDSCIDTAEIGAPRLFRESKQCMPGRDGDELLPLIQKADRVRLYWPARREPPKRVPIRSVQSDDVTFASTAEQQSSRSAQQSRPGRGMQWKFPN